jgi:hypothetical protein
MNSLPEPVNPAKPNAPQRKSSPIINFLDFAPNPRIILFYFIVPLQLIASAVSAVGFVQRSAVFFLSGSVLWLLWFIAIFITGTRSADRRLAKYSTRLKNIARVVFVICLIVGILELVMLIGFHTYLNDIKPSGWTNIWNSFDEGFGYTDATALTHQATENFLAGKNPYSNTNVVQALLEFNPHPDRVTPLRVGRFANSFPYPTEQELDGVWNLVIQNPQQPPPEYVSKLSYPAGSFLLAAPFVLAGVHDFRIVYLAFVILGLAYAAYLIPSNKKLLFIGITLISFDLWNSIADGETGSLVFPFLLLAFMLAKHKFWLSAIFMGIAVATKQTAWFFLPFYLIIIFKNASLSKFGYAVLIIAGVFSAFNLPFMISDLKLWFASIFDPMSGDMFPLGIGIVTLVTSGLWHVYSPLAFDIIEFCVMAAGFFWYLINYSKYPYAGPVLAITPLFFAWRSLWPYFFYTVIIILAMMLVDKYEEPSSQTGDRPSGFLSRLRAI